MTEILPEQDSDKNHHDDWDTPASVTGPTTFHEKIAWVMLVATALVYIPFLCCPIVYWPYPIPPERPLHGL